MLGILLLLVVLFGLVFTLGYLLGRSQYDTQLRAAASSVPEVPRRAADKSASRDVPAGPPPSDWEFYHSAEPAKPPEPISASPKSAPAEAVRVPLKSSSRRAPAANLKEAPKSPSSPLIARGATVLQVAAFARQADARALAQALQQKKFPAFVLPRGVDRYYRVQVGPYGDALSAAAARKKLEDQGFKTIIKR
jgi:cell division septation protein DedD